MLIQVYVYDIIFGSTNLYLCQDFSKIMQGEVEMSMIGELTYFLGLQINQCMNGTFFNQAKYTLELLKRFVVFSSKLFSTPMSPSLKLDSNPNGKKVDVTLYRGMIGSFCILLLVDLISCLVCAYVLAIKPILKNHIFHLSSGL